MARPLNKKMDEGGFYTRRPEIEACIDEALAQSPERVLRRAAIRNFRDPDYMPMECLLHLMREASRILWPEQHILHMEQEPLSKVAIQRALVK